MGAENGGNTSNILVIFGQKLVFRDLEIPLFLLAAITFYIVCYVMKAPDDERSAGLNSVRIAFLSYALFFILCDLHVHIRAPRARVTGAREPCDMDAGNKPPVF